MKYLTIIPLITVVACSTPEPLCDRERQPWDKYETQEDQCTETTTNYGLIHNESSSVTFTDKVTDKTKSTPVSKINPEKPKDNVKDKKGNASANNKKGGNYDKTGHEDNGKGKGRYK